VAQIRILGSGTVVPDAFRSSAAHLVESGDVRLLLDCGTGTVHAFSQHGVEWGRLTHVAITHYHTDHVTDLAALMQAFRYGQSPPRSEALELIGPPGFEVFLVKLAAALGNHVLEPGFPVTVRETMPGEKVDLGGGVFIECIETPHSEESVAYRVTTPEGVVGYTGDTGPSRAVADFLAQCRVLIAECSLPDDSPVEGHLTPSSLASLARSASPELLVVTHVYPLLTPGQVIDQIQAEYEGACMAAWDGMCIRMSDALAVDPPGTPV
jgi:ribonuclease BN (tRNA processing enzyme)